MNITRDDLVEFKRITSADIETFLQQVIVFLNGGYNRIVSFYSGRSVQVERKDFIDFTELERNIEYFFSVYQQQRIKLKNLRWWLLLEHLEEIDMRLKSLRKINKWSRSSLTNFGYDPSIQVHYTLRAKQTLERVSQDILLNQNPNDEWLDIAITNQLKEEDYTVDGGNDLQLSFPRINKGVNVNAVVDVMIGKSIYGKDIDRKIQFDTDEDLKTLGYDDTVQQSVDILIGLRKNDNPDFPALGLQSSVVIGSNRASLNFPIIGRQYQETFATDDSFKDFQILNIQVLQDQLKIEFQIKTRLNETVDGEILI